MSTHAPDWYPDPFGRFDHRWHDGTGWTATVSRAGEQLTDPQGVAPGHTPTSARAEERVRRQVERQVESAGATAQRSASHHGLLDADVLVVNQKAKLVELSNEYMIYDEHGTQVGAVRQTNQSTGRKVARFLLDVDQFLTHKLEVTGPDGVTVLSLTRPAKLMRSTVIVDDARGSEIGRIVQQNVFGRIRFDLVAGGRSVGALKAENWRAWDFTVLDEQGVEVARIRKTFEGLARAMFTTADNYVVRIHRPLSDPLRSLVVAAAVSVDTALKQDDRGGGA